MDDKETLQPLKERPRIEPTIDDQGFLHASEIIAPGILIDSEGRRFTIPEDISNDEGLYHYKSPFDIPKDPNFYYQFEGVGELSRLSTEGFVPVTRRELGMPDIGIVAEYGTNLDTYYRVGDLVCVKIPKVLEQRKRKSQERFCQAAVDATLPSKTARARGEIKGDDEAAAVSRFANGQSGDKNLIVQAEATRKTIIAKPRHPEKERVS